MLAVAVQAADWQVTPYISLSGRLTDNLNLSPSDKKTGLITEIGPGITVSRTGPRLYVDADYRLQNFIYLIGDADSRSTHSLRATANAELVDNFFFLDASASASEENTSLLGALSQDRSNATGNLTNVRFGKLSPYLKHRFGNDAIGEARWTTSYVTSNSGVLSNSVGNDLSLRVDSGPAFDDFRWNGSFINEKIDYRSAAARDTEFRRLTLGGSYPLRPRLRALGTIGYEDNDYVTTGDDAKGEFWTIGLQWTPSARSSLQATTGRRFYGTTYGIDAQYRTSRSSWSLGYSQDLTTSRSEFVVPATLNVATFLDAQFRSQIPNDADRARFVEDQIARGVFPRTLPFGLQVISNQTYLLKRFSASTVLRLPKSTLAATLFDTVRDVNSIGAVVLGASDFASSRTIRQTGATGQWTWLLDQRTNVGLGLNLTRENFKDINRTDTLTSVSVGANRRVRRNVSAGVELRHNRRDSNTVNADYQENSLFGIVDIRF